MENTNKHKEDKKTESKLSVSMSIIIASLFIALAIFLGFKNIGGAKNETAFTDPDSLFSGRELKQEEFVIGKADAKVVLVEYSDLECPFCKKFHIETMDKVYEKYEGKVSIAYRHYPLPFHKKAPKEAEATLCARELGGQIVYKNYISKIFQNTNGNDSLDHALLPKMAEELGINVTSFNECLSSGKYASQVQADLTDGMTVGVEGTPNTFVLVKEGSDYKILTVINGARDEKYVSKVIDQALKLSK
jgi:protein-disulfide isomerase